MKNIIGFFVVLAIGLQAFAQAEKEVAAWKHTNLSYKLLEELYVNDKNCLTSEKNFMGCVDALAMLAQRQNKSEFMALLSTKHAVASEDIVLTMGDLVIAKDRQANEMRTKKLNGLQAYKMRKAYQKEQDNVWLSLYPQAAAMNFPFAQTLRQIALKLDPNLEPMLAGYAVNEYLQSAKDPHSYIMPQETQDERANSGDEKIVGIGISVNPADGALFVIGALPGGPAEKAGIKAKDIIVAVDKKSLAGMPSKQAVEMITGPVGTHVIISVLRSNQPLEFDIVRSEILNQNVRARIIPTANGGKVGYLKLNIFMGKNVCLDFTENMIGFQQDKTVKGAVIDLRGNGGGDLAIVGCMLDAFLPARKIVISTHNPETDVVIDVTMTRDDRIFFNKSLVVLVDGYSASASEIFAGAVQDHKLGYVVGVRSFGKGTVQRLTEDPVLEGVLRAQTIGRFHLPSGRTNQIVGILPDFEAYSSPNPTEDDKFSEREEDRFRSVVKTANTQRTVFIDRLAETSTCVAGHTANQKMWTTGDDYSLLVAEDVISCDRPGKGPALVLR